MTDAPLIHTMRGNLPIADLAYSTEWQETASATVFIETYRLAGDVVRSSVHVLSKTGIAGDSVAERMI